MPTRASDPILAHADVAQALAGFIFGGNKESEKLAMTTPVFTSTDSAGTRKMAFVLPSRFWGGTADAPPTPIDANVVVEDAAAGGLLGARVVGVLWFGGLASESEVSRRTAELQLSIEQSGEWHVVQGASSFLMQYNDPFTPPWARRNEVAIAISDAAKSAETPVDVKPPIVSTSNLPSVARQESQTKWIEQALQRVRLSRGTATTKTSRSDTLVTIPAATSKTESTSEEAIAAVMMGEPLPPNGFEWGLTL